jgi:hypothetical protein
VRSHAVRPDRHRAGHGGPRRYRYRPLPHRGHPQRGPVRHPRHRPPDPLGSGQPSTPAPAFRTPGHLTSLPARPATIHASSGGTTPYQRLKGGPNAAVRSCVTSEEPPQDAEAQPAGDRASAEVLQDRLGFLEGPPVVLFPRSIRLGPALEPEPVFRIDSLRGGAVFWGP